MEKTAWLENMRITIGSTEPILEVVRERLADIDFKIDTHQRHVMEYVL
jgi:hypothetical protein